MVFPANAGGVTSIIQLKSPTCSDAHRTPHTARGEEKFWEGSRKKVGG